MNTEQIIDDLYIVRDVIQLSPTPARLAAAAIMLRAAAKAIEDAAAAAAAASSDPAPGHPELPLEPMPVEADPDTPEGYRPLAEGEVIQSGDVFRRLVTGNLALTTNVGAEFDSRVLRQVYRPIAPDTAVS